VDLEFNATDDYKLNKTHDEELTAKEIFAGIALEISPVTGNDSQTLIFLPSNIKNLILKWPFA